MGHRLHACKLGLLVLALSSLWGCGGDDDGGNVALAAAGEPCERKAQCEADLVCAFGRCHLTCERDNDCQNATRCVRGVATLVCQLGDDISCRDDDDCVGDQVCAVDRECRDECDEDDDCTPGQVCTSSGHCASPDLDSLDARGNLLPFGSAGQEDAGSGEDAAMMSMPDAMTPEPVDLTLSNIDSDALPASPSLDMRIAADCRFDSEAGTFSCSETHKEDFNFAVVEPEDSSRIGVMRVRTLQVDAGGILRVTGNLPLVIVADQSVKVFGRISAASSKVDAVGGGFISGNGPGAGQVGLEGLFRPSSGGSYCGVGGHGATASGPGVAGGPVYGNETLTPLLGGSGGGSEDTGVLAGGGAGGGALQVVAGVQIQVGATGVIDAGGGGGGNGGNGGGSGGAILLEAPEVSVAGVLAANGGGGAASVGGGGGLDANPSATPAAGEIANLGGQGSGGDETSGGDGMFNTENEALGGGGGAGRIRINTKSGSADITGTLSPSVESGCATEGTL